MPTQHTVVQGECFSSIAAQYGFPWESLWNHPDNAELKRKRNDPAVLYPGDVVSVPDKSIKKEACPTDNRHRFQKKVSRTRIKIRLLEDGEPRTGVRYELQVAGRTITGSTDGGGYLEAEIPADARTGLLMAGSGTVRDIFELGFGTLDPLDTEEGVRRRLEALGYEVTDLAGAVRAFQTKEALEANGRIDDRLRAKLKEKFGQ